MSSGQVYGYLRSATAKHNPSGIGKLRGRFRWVRFTPCTSSIFSDQKQLLRSAVACSFSEQDRFLLLSAIRVAVEKWGEANEDEGESHDSNVTMSLESIKHYYHDNPSSFNLWWMDIESDSSLNFLFFGSDPGHAVRSVRFREDLSFNISVMGSEVDIPGSPFPSTLSSEENFLSILRAVAHATECSGCPYDKFEALIERRLDGGYSKAWMALLLRGWKSRGYPTAPIRTAVCPYFIVSGRRCSPCTTFYGTLRKSLSRMSNASPVPSIHTPFVRMTREDLIARLRSETKNFRT